MALVEVLVLAGALVQKLVEVLVQKLVEVPEAKSVPGALICSLLLLVLSPFLLLSWCGIGY